MKDKRDFTGTLPTGKVTHSTRVYTKAWRALAKPIEQRLGWRRYAYEPNIAFMLLSGRIVDVPVEIALEFARMDAELKELKK